MRLWTSSFGSEFCTVLSYQINKVKGLSSSFLSILRIPKKVAGLLFLQAYSAGPLGSWQDRTS